MPAKCQNAQLRSMRERVRQALTYEAGALFIATPLYALIFGASEMSSFIVIAAVALACLIWAPIHNALFDVADLRLTGRLASDRPHRLRFLHAASHEVTSIVVSTPVIMWSGGHGLWTALGIDLGLTLGYAGYAYVFYLGYDRLWPVGREASASVRPASTQPDADDQSLHWRS
jgi:uncharacterized membrane protein